MTIVQIIEEVHDFEQRLGRHIEHDIRSLDYKVASNPFKKIQATVAPKTSVLWQRYSPILDQGQLGSCTGNAITGWLGCAPHATTTAFARQYNEDFAIKVYEQATIIDGVPGSYPPDDTGSSGLAVAKVAKSMGLISSYKTATTTNELILALHTAPVIVGVAWYENFFTPDSKGQVHVGGKIAGGHEFLIRGYDAKTKLFTADNSWGTSWGIKGSFTFSTATWESLRKQQADVVLPIK